MRRAINAQLFSSLYRREEMHHHCHRAFHKPSILVLDEPSAGLDSQARRTLINLLRQLPITTHDMRLVQELFPRTIVMDEGQVVADGLTKEILENEELLTAHGLEKP
jgi:cobalt/nickel transport system ATP-binding protein